MFSSSNKIAVCEGCQSELCVCTRFCDCAASMNTINKLWIKTWNISIMTNFQSNKNHIRVSGQCHSASTQHRFPLTYPFEIGEELWGADESGYKTKQRCINLKSPIYILYVSYDIRWNINIYVWMRPNTNDRNRSTVTNLGSLFVMLSLNPTFSRASRISHSW